MILNCKYLSIRILPIIALSLSPMANITRLTRSSMLDVLGQDNAFRLWRRRQLRTGISAGPEVPRNGGSGNDH